MDFLDELSSRGLLADVTDRAGLQAWRDMLVAIRDSIGKMVASGKTLEQVLAAKPTQQWDAAWGQKFIKPEVLVSTVYRELKEKR